jgi:plasmid stability protein
MATLTIRIPDDKHGRLKALAKYHHLSVNKLIEELSTQALAEFDSEVRFRALAANGDTARGLEILNKHDSHFFGRLTSVSRSSR